MLGHPVKVNVLDELRNVKTCNLGYIILSMLYTNKRLRKQLSYNGYLSPCQV